MTFFTNKANNVSLSYNYFKCRLCRKYFDFHRIKRTRLRIFQKRFDLWWLEHVSQSLPIKTDRVQNILTRPFSRIQNVSGDWVFQKFYLPTLDDCTTSLLVTLFSKQQPSGLHVLEAARTAGVIDWSGDTCAISLLADEGLKFWMIAKIQNKFLNEKLIIKVMATVKFTVFGLFRWVYAVDL